jgi:hypothetical protein
MINGSAALPVSGVIKFAVIVEIRIKQKRSFDLGFMTHPHYIQKSDV